MARATSKAAATNTTLPIIVRILLKEEDAEEWQSQPPSQQAVSGCACDFVLLSPQQLLSPPQQFLFSEFFMDGLWLWMLVVDVV
jgi:hypothetical protein